VGKKFVLKTYLEWEVPAYTCRSWFVRVSALCYCQSSRACHWNTLLSITPYRTI